MGFSLRNRRIWVAGHNGLVGRALVRRLGREDCAILTADRARLDLRRQQDVEAWIRDNRPDAIILAAATVGGIEANRTRPAEFIYDNIMIAANVIDAAAKVGVEKLLFLGSSCIYPRDAAQPMAEDDLLTGVLEPTNEFYALAKISGIKLCQSYRRQHGCDFISAMPCNLYGPGDRYDAVRSHVIPALMMKFHAARKNRIAATTLWGTGTPLREFLHAGDLAEALVLMLREYEGEVPLNIGSGEEISIRDLAVMIAGVTGYEGSIHFDSSKPDGAPRKLLESGGIRGLGWTPCISLRAGLEEIYELYARQDNAGAA
jgi:GDP-L-fucose synthase